jgi:hypothetical protein
LSAICFLRCNFSRIPARINHFEKFSSWYMLEVYGTCCELPSGIRRSVAQSTGVRVSRGVAEASAVEEGQVQLVEALGIGDRVDLDDLTAPDLEVQYHKEPSTRGHDDPHGAVHEHRSRGPGASYERHPGHGRRTADLPRCVRRQGGAVGSEHDVRVEHRDKRVEVSIARGGEEGVDDFSLAGEIQVV